MLKKTEFLEKIKHHNPSANCQLVEKAYDFCIKAHAGQFRKSKEPYHSHPIEVAEMLIDINIDDTTIIVALLHDVLEDTKYTKEDLQQEFSDEIATLVDGVTKFEKIKFQEQQLRQAENFRKLFLAISKDVRVLIVKLFDRLHNIETIEFHDDVNKQRIIATETLEIYAPLAEKIGLQMIKNELQNKCFKILEPEAYQIIIDKINIVKNDYNTTNIIDDVVNELKATMDKHDISCNIIGREKNPYSIFMKMKSKKISLDELSDIIAFRIIVDNPNDCYKVLGAIHLSYHAVPNKFDDYISTPKINNYQSIHTTIMGPKKNLIEIQIRTNKMHAEAEYGLAAHWKYKTTTTNSEQILRLKSAWVYRVLNILETAKNPYDLMKATKTEIKEDMVYIFTPDGDMIDLPKGATILDFAMCVNPDLFIYFDHAKVDGEIVGYNYILKNGNRIRIATDCDIRIKPEWMNHVVTGRATEFINSYFKETQ